MLLIEFEDLKAGDQLCSLQGSFKHLTKFDDTLKSEFHILVYYCVYISV